MSAIDNSIAQLEDDIRYCEEQIRHLQNKILENEKLIEYYEQRQWTQERILINEKMKLEK